MGKRGNHSCTLMLTDWPWELGKELGTTTTYLCTICKSFEVIIEWNTRECFPFPNHYLMYTRRCVNVSLLITLFIWPHILDPSLVVFSLLQVITRKLGEHRGSSINLHSWENVTPSLGTPFLSSIILFKSNKHVFLCEFICNHIMLSRVLGNSKDEGPIE